MKEKERVPFSAVGASSLLVIFAVLALTVLALLGLNTVLAQGRLLDNSLEASKGWYEADLEAETILARLRAGEDIPDVQPREGIYRYSCRISEQQMLEVVIQRDGELWTVLRWQAVAEQPDVDQALPVWGGQTEEEAG